MTVRISVIVPTFNTATALESTLESVMGQTRCDFEIIVLDDGSTDETQHVLKRIVQNEPRLIVKRQAHQGTAAARRAAIAASMGELLAFVSPGDLWHPSKLEKQVAALDKAPAHVKMIYCWSRFIDQNQQVVEDDMPLGFDEWQFHQHVYMPQHGNRSSLLVRRNAALVASRFDDELRRDEIKGAEDLLFHLRLATEGLALHVPEYLVGSLKPVEDEQQPSDQRLCSVTRAIDLASMDVADFPVTSLRWTRAALLYDLIGIHLSESRPLAAFGRYLQALCADPKMVIDRHLSAVGTAMAISADQTAGRPFLGIDPTLVVRPVRPMVRRRLNYLARLNPLANRTLNVAT